VRSFYNARAAERVVGVCERLGHNFPIDIY
jgi:phage shock protein PspC (stress-responsive transcriptional regulator)